MPEQADQPRVVFQIEMVVGEHRLEASAHVPDGMMRLADLVAEMPVERRETVRERFGKGALAPECVTLSRPSLYCAGSP